jgi:hypothetical protein
MKTFIVRTRAYTSYAYEVSAENAEKAEEKFNKGDWNNIEEEEMMVDAEEEVIEVREKNN